MRQDGRAGPLSGERADQHTSGVGAGHCATTRGSWSCLGREQCRPHEVLEAAVTESRAGEAPQRVAVSYVRVSTADQADRGADPEGFSIPAQRDACRRKAAGMDAVVRQEYVDRGESARSADRPELQRMLGDIAREPVDFVIVHKIDRLARNRSDDVMITAAIVASGARLVSVSENIDETPSGVLLHGIMSSIAEFYSRNLATEVIKGTQQKVLAGGTHHVAPIGYRNVRRVVDAREERVVELDPERSSLVSWAFEAYATGQWSLKSLAAELEVRGLTFRATPKRPERPVTASKLHHLLRNRYYLGVVRYKGVEHDGRHPRLVTAATFEQVQLVLESHRRSGERAYRRDHYLVGSLRCNRCRERLLYGVSTGRNREEYGYFFCAGRHSGRGPCSLRYLPEQLVEEAVARQWLLEQVSAEQLRDFRATIQQDLDAYAAGVKRDSATWERQVHAIRRERFKWAEKAMQGSVPDDIAVAKQAQLAGQLAHAESQLARLSTPIGDRRQTLDAVLDLLHQCGDLYQQLRAWVAAELQSGLVRGPRC